MAKAKPDYSQNHALVRDLLAAERAWHQALLQDPGADEVYGQFFAMELATANNLIAWFRMPRAQRGRLAAAFRSRDAAFVRGLHPGRRFRTWCQLFPELHLVAEKVRAQLRELSMGLVGLYVAYVGGNASVKVLAGRAPKQKVPESPPVEQAPP